MSSPAVRLATSEDVEDLARLMGQLGYPAEPGVFAERLARYRAEGGTVVVAEVDGRPAGLAALQVQPTLQREEPNARITAFVVDEEHRGMGVGRALADDLAARAQNAGAASLQVASADRRDDAHAFYTALGFTRTGLRFARATRPS